jgi:hypothetical protein
LSVFLTERMLTYAVGRGLEYYDMPAVRTIVQDARSTDYRFSSIVLGVVPKRAVPDERDHLTCQGDPMSALFKKHLSRRTFIRGVGVTMSLPFLDAMVPARTASGADGGPATGQAGPLLHPAWRGDEPVDTATTGALELSPILSPLAAHKDQVVVLSNLAHAQAGPQGAGDNGGDHTRCPAVFLNGVHPKRTDGADIQAGVTIDQMAAAQIGQDTLLPSLELAVEDYSGLVGSCDVGFSCTYMNTISWRTPTSPLPMEINPRVVFDRMFGDGATAKERLQRIDTQRSILDAITGQVRRLQGDLGVKDRNRVGEYLDAVREIERRIQISERQASESVAGRARSHQPAFPTITRRIPS